MRRERTPLAIAAAIPQGSVRVRRASQWVALVEDRAETELLRTDRRATLHALAKALLERTDATRTTAPSWAFLMERTGRSRATVARHLADLQRWGLLGVIASGRRGIFAPGGRLSKHLVAGSQVPATNGQGDPANEVAVYVLCEKSPVQLVVDEASVDESETPPLKRVNASPRTRAREQSRTQAEPLRGADFQAATRPPQRAAWRQLPAWPAAVTPSGKDNMLRAASELQRRLPVLRRISTQHVRSVCREFFLAGWTVSDVQRAIDWRPAGHAWAHSGDTAVENVGAWLAYRLNAWRNEGTVTRSHTQRTLAEATEAKARARSRTEELARHQHATAGRPRSEAAKAAMAAARAAASAEIRARTRANAGTES